MTSNNLEKYEYLTGEDFDFKPSAIEQTEFEYSSLCKMFNMGLDKKEKDKKEGLFKRLKNIENAQKNLISSNDDDDDDDDDDKSIYYTPRSQFDEKDKMHSKPPNVSDYLKSQIDLDGEINKLKYVYKPKNAEEKEKINRVLVHAKNISAYSKKIIEAFKDGTFPSEYLKKSDDDAYDHVLKNVKNFIQKIESMAEKINLSLFEDFFGLPSPANYAKMLINTKNPDENKENVAEIVERISYLKDRTKQMSKKEKKLRCR